MILCCVNIPFHLILTGDHTICVICTATTIKTHKNTSQWTVSVVTDDREETHSVERTGLGQIDILYNTDPVLLVVQTGLALDHRHGCQWILSLTPQMTFSVVSLESLVLSLFGPKKRTLKVKIKSLPLLPHIPYDFMNAEPADSLPFVSPLT